MGARGRPGFRLVRVFEGLRDLGPRREIQAEGVAMDVKDSNGSLLAEGDSVTVIKDRKVS